VCCERTSGTEGRAAEGVAGEDAVAECKKCGEASAKAKREWGEDKVVGGVEGRSAGEGVGG
jgi:hypothetical protein